MGKSVVYYELVDHLCFLSSLGVVGCFNSGTLSAWGHLSLKEIPQMNNLGCSCDVEAASPFLLNFMTCIWSPGYKDHHVLGLAGLLAHI